MSLEIQFLTLSMMVVGGTLMGVMFDVLRIGSGQFNIPRSMMPFVDLFYWMAATAVVFKLLYLSNDGQLRGFVFIGLIMGIVIYLLYIQNWFVKTVKWCLDVLLKMLRIIWRMFFVVVVIPAISLFRVIVFIGGFFVSIAIFLNKYVIQWSYRQIIKRLFRRKT